MLDLPGQFIEQQALFSEGQQLLLAVSGGIDSMVLAHLALRAAWPIGIAHCNFQLRGEASNEDENFVKLWAQQKGIPFFSVRFDTLAQAKQGGISIQMAARELRYSWLQQIRADHGYDYIATAHHLNDSIETILYNLSKGCGLRGLHGIPPKNENIIRPLLGITRHQIEQFAKEEGIFFREDASNAEDKYARNFIRHHLTPAFQQLNPAFEYTMAGNIRRIQEAEYLMGQQIEAYKHLWLENLPNGHLKIKKTPLAEHPASLTIMTEWLGPMGFSSGLLEQALDAQTHVGAYFESSTHRLLIDRDFFLIEPQPEKRPANNFTFDIQTKTLKLENGKLEIALFEEPPGSFPPNHNSVILDADTLLFPLTIRHWQAGDWFCPLGMNGRRKKLQDYFSDAKLSRFDKEKIWLITTANGHIVWIVGHRMDERFKISEQTSAYFQIHFEAQ